MEIDPFLDGQRCAARLCLTHQARMACMRGRIEGQPVKRVTATDKRRKFWFTEIGQQPAGLGLSCRCTRILPFVTEPA